MCKRSHIVLVAYKCYQGKNATHRTMYFAVIIKTQSPCKTCLLYQTGTLPLQLVNFISGVN